ncbi:hypothetical protein ASD8599_00084 [Ascidiaceihabitans donghaensis]|uniref:Uncharacterized protein n=1 Tax=Ascidiaceihabitans donghaensis TaxID=1510460 RepID=A0A2R8B8G7_9RHOB|nr:hypothetical protein [Ascidiaceihabitans donghaensis]SPH19359.1 hypothetical protein ASD8599_00084 [Ascidiaceihabitans donghaensis]
MKSTLHIVIFAFFPHFLFANPIPVRTGDHDNFTRVVLSVPSSKNWIEEVSGRVIIIKIPDHKVGFDTSKAFDRIGRDRISSFKANSSNLEIQMECDCTVESYRTVKNLIVLDIFDQNDVVNANLQVDQVDFAHLGARNLQLPKAPKEEFEVNAPRAQKEPPVDVGQVRNMNENATETSLKMENGGSLKGVREILLQEFGSSATRGILSVSSALPAGEERSPQIDLSIFDENLEDSLERSEVGSPNIEVSSSSDLLNTSAAQQIIQSSGFCADADLLQISQWGEKYFPISEVGKLRSAIFDELQQVEPQEVLKLAKLYLHLGFGAEAAATLNLVPSLKKNHPELYAIAEIMEFSKSSNGKFFKDMESCNSAAAMWALFSNNISEIRSAEVNTDAVIFALNDLPISLRENLAPTISNQLLALDLSAAADLALRTLERSSEFSTVDVVLARSNLDTVDNSPQESKKNLRYVIDSNTLQSAEALIKLIDLEFENDGQISEQQLILASAYTMELRRHDLSHEIQRAFILALTMNGEFSRSLRILEDYVKERTKFQTDGLQNRVVQYLTKHSTVEEFLLFAFGTLDKRTLNLNASTMKKISERLEELGFLEQAVSFSNMATLSTSVVGVAGEANVNTIGGSARNGETRKIDNDPNSIPNSSEELEPVLAAPQEKPIRPELPSQEAAIQKNTSPGVDPNGFLKKADEALIRSIESRVLITKFLED